MSLLLYIIIFIFVLGIIILIHEFGHFLFARRAGILCHEFSIGMGPALYKFKRGETTYAIRAIPLGGYVSMAGEEPETDKLSKGQVVYLKTLGNIVQKIYFYKPSDVKVQFAKVINYDLYGKDENKLFIHYEDETGETKYVNVAEDAFYQFKDNQEMQIAPYDRCFESKSWMNRFLTVVAGAMFNFILAVVIFMIINLITGVPVSDPIIGNVGANTPAQNAGLQAEDEIVHMAINNSSGVDIDNWQDVSDFMSSYESGVINITVERDGNEITLSGVQPEVFIATVGIQSTTDLSKTTIGAISSNSNAEKEGLQPGDEIIKIEGTLNDNKNTEKVENQTIVATKENGTLNNWTDVSNIFEKFYLGEEVNITVLRNNEEITFLVQSIKALEEENVSHAMIGISQKTEFNLFKSIRNGFTDTAHVIGSVFQTLGLLFGDANVGVGDLSGPVGIYDMTKTFAMAGLVSLLGWMAFISANIGFVNLLPLPALDGGRLIFLIIEGVSRKPVNRKVEGYIHTVGFILFLMLFLFITFNDILRLS